jgi:hypothetical protein
MTLKRDIVSKDYEVRKKAIRSSSISSGLIDIALKDKDPRIVRMAYQHPNLSFESATKLIRLKKKLAIRHSTIISVIFAGKPESQKRLKYSRPERKLQLRKLKADEMARQSLLH